MYNEIIEIYHRENTRKNFENADKIYDYTILDKNFQQIAKGKCKNVSLKYDVSNDYNIVSFTDIDTEKKYSMCQFYVELQ